MPVLVEASKGNTLSDQSLTIIVDIDGTLVDSNYHHAIAWSRARGASI